MPGSVSMKDADLSRWRSRKVPLFPFSHWQFPGKDDVAKPEWVPVPNLRQEARSHSPRTQSARDAKIPLIANAAQLLVRCRVGGIGALPNDPHDLLFSQGQCTVRGKGQGAHSPPTTHTKARQLRCLTLQDSSAGLANQLV